jgi:hypothetical protein
MDPGSFLWRTMMSGSDEWLVKRAKPERIQLAVADQ